MVPFWPLCEWAKLVALRTGCLKSIAEWAVRWQLFLDELRKEHPGQRLIQQQEWGLFLLEHLFHNATAIRKRKQQWHAWRCQHFLQTAMAEEMAPEHPSIRSLLGSTDDEILEIAEQVYWGQYEAVSSILPHWHQEQFMAELYEELGQNLTRAGLWEATRTGRSPSRGRRCSCAYSLSQA